MSKSTTTSKKPRLSAGFCSAASVLADPSIIISEESGESAGRKPRLSPGGFCSAASVLADPSIINVVSNEGEEEVVHKKPSSNSATKGVEFHIFLTCVGWPHHSHLHNDTKPSTGVVVVLEREPTNEHDTNAVAVSLVEDSDSTIRKKIGYIKKEQSVMLAPLMDRNIIVTFSNVSISAVYRSSFLLRATGSMDTIESLPALDSFSHAVGFQSTNASNKIKERDIQQASSSPFLLSELQPLSWLPTPSVMKKAEAWSLTDPYNSSKVAALSMHDIDQCKGSWPPPEEIFLRLGLAPANDATWWCDSAGLLPPVQWNVSGALDVTSKLSSLSTTHRKIANDTLNGAIHGVTNVWHPDTLAAVTKLTEKPNFWCRRSSDALIRAFGGAYVLGQEADKLVLVRGAPHTALTEKMCLAHNLVYTAVHLTPPAFPGFNTIIFGCNHSGAGFHYHQDAVSELKAKNSSLIPRQPVVTTVVYQKPDDDSGKEVVLWKPLLNFSSAGSEIYNAARAVLTTHGMMHVQQAGLQSKAVHGVFHTPHDTNQRKGYRVAVTARISKLNSDEIVEEFSRKGSYCEEYGPGGDCSCLDS